MSSFKSRENIQKKSMGQTVHVYISKFVQELTYCCMYESDKTYNQTRRFGNFHNHFCTFTVNVRICNFFGGNAADTLYWNRTLVVFWIKDVAQTYSRIRIGNMLKIRL